MVRCSLVGMTRLATSQLKLLRLTPILDYPLMDAQSRAKCGRPINRYFSLWHSLDASIGYVTKKSPQSFDWGPHLAQLCRDDKIWTASAVARIPLKKAQPKASNKSLSYPRNLPLKNTWHHDLSRESRGTTHFGFVATNGLAQLGSYKTKVA